jgi:hypothetical protein
VVGDEPHIATVSAVATVGSTHRLGALTTETDAARAAVTASNVQLALVDELRHFLKANAADRTASRIVCAWLNFRSRTQLRIGPIDGRQR